MSIRILATALIAVTVAGSLATAQTPASLQNRRAIIPSQSDLDRLNLTLAWRVSAPVLDLSDGIVTVQPIDDQLFVQTRGGVLMYIQANTDPKGYRKPGEVIWTHKSERPPVQVYPIAAGAAEVYMVSNQDLLVLNRADGKVKFRESLGSAPSAGPVVDDRALYLPLNSRKIVCYKVSPVTGRYDYNELIPSYVSPKPPPVPDPVRKVEIALEASEPLSSPSNPTPSLAAVQQFRPPFKRGPDQIDVMPTLNMSRTVRPPYESANNGRSPSLAPVRNMSHLPELNSKDSPTRLVQLWEMYLPSKTDASPFLASDSIDPYGSIFSYYRDEVFSSLRMANRTNAIQSSYRSTANVTAPLVSHDDLMYIATADASITAVSIRELRESASSRNAVTRGRYPSGGPVEQKPLLTDESVYIVGTRAGAMRLHRLGLLKGKPTPIMPAWNARLNDGRLTPAPNSEVNRLGSVNSNYIYGFNSSNQLVILDARNGITLSTYDTSAYTVPVLNEVDDRLYLASNNGLILCLHERSRTKPELLRARKVEKKEPAPMAAPEMKKDAEAPAPEPKKEEPKKEDPKKE